MYEHIVVGTDGSERALDAVRAAGRLGDAKGLQSKFAAGDGWQILLFLSQSCCRWFLTQLALLSLRQFH